MALSLGVSVSMNIELTPHRAPEARMPTELPSTCPMKGALSELALKILYVAFSFWPWIWTMAFQAMYFQFSLER